MEKREPEKKPYSAEIRWYSPFVQNEFIRGVKDSLRGFCAIKGRTD